MFQYAYAKALESKGYHVKLDISNFETYKLHGGYQLDKYNINLPIANKNELKKYQKGLCKKILNRLKITKIDLIAEKDLSFDESLLSPTDDNYIFGYFQNEKYFLNIKKSIATSYCIKKNFSSYVENAKGLIQKQSNSCSIHVRRGDFINSANSSIHGSCDIRYYQDAIKYMENKAGEISYFIFSDDIAWCKENLKLKNAHYMDNNDKKLPHGDIYLMSLCNHNIMANSSFSWWGAWLNKNNKKIVIAPKRWLSNKKLEEKSVNIVCKDWIKM